MKGLSPCLVAKLPVRDPEHDTDYWQNEEDSRTRGEKKRWMIVGRVEHKEDRHPQGDRDREKYRAANDPG